MFYEDIIDVTIKKSIDDVVKHVYEKELSYKHNANYKEIYDYISNDMFYSGYYIFEKNIEK